MELQEDRSGITLYMKQIQMRRTFMRIFYPAILLFCLTAHAAPGKIAGDRVNVRNQASTQGTVIARYDRKEEE